MNNKTCKREFTSHAFEAENDVKRVRVKQRGVRTHRTQDMLEPGHASRTHLGHT